MHLSFNKKPQSGPSIIHIASTTMHKYVNHVHKASHQPYMQVQTRQLIQRESAGFQSVYKLLRTEEKIRTTYNCKKKREKDRKKKKDRNLKKSKIELIDCSISKHKPYTAGCMWQLNIPEGYDLFCSICPSLLILAC